MINNNNNNLDLYISTEDKKHIYNYCKVQMDNKDLIRPKAITCLLQNKYAVYEVLQYIRSLNIDNKYIWRGNTTDYIFTLPRGHIQITNNDVYFIGCYYHQYVIAKELNLEMEQVQRYIIHHQDQNKANNDISNLWIFYDRAVHLSYHQLIKHNADVDIKEFTLNYVNDILNADNAEQIKEYLQVLDKLQAKKEKYLSMGIDKHLDN